MLKEIFRTYKKLIKGILVFIAFATFCYMTYLPIKLYPILCNIINNMYITIALYVLFYLFYFATIKGIYDYIQIKKIMKEDNMSYEKAREYYQKLAEDFLYTDRPIEPDD